MTKVLPLAVVLFAAAGLLVTGIGQQFGGPAAWMAAGVLLAVWACLFLLDVGGRR